MARLEIKALEERFISAFMAKNVEAIESCSILNSIGLYAAKANILSDTT